MATFTGIVEVKMTITAAMPFGGADLLADSRDMACKLAECGFRQAIEMCLPTIPWDGEIEDVSSTVLEDEK
jgi:hypothetical protein